MPGYSNFQLQMTVIFANILGGLGLFFIGIKLIGSHLKQIAGRGLRERVAWAVHKPWRAGLLGVLSGALTQSSIAVTLIATSMNTAGLVTIRQAMPLVIWANLGTAAIVMVATVDIHLAVLFLLGAVGLVYYFDVNKSDRWRHPVGALLGLALLFRGLQFIKQGAAPLREMHEVRELLQSATQYLPLLFLAGAAMALIVPASTAAIIAVAMTTDGLLTIDGTILVIYGANLGAAANLWLMTANLRGTARQLALLQIGLRCVAGGILLILLALELKFGWPLMKALVTSLSTNIGRQAAWVFLLYQLLGALVMSLGAGPVRRLLRHYSPPSCEEALARPKYIFDLALDDALTALDLVEREQGRLLNCLPAYLSAADMERTGELATPIPALLQGNRALAGQIATFITELINRQQDRLALDRMLNLQSRNRLIDDLREGVYELDGLLARTRPTAASGNQALESNITEALHFLLLALHDAALSPDPDDLELLQALSGDRAEVIEKLRHQLLRQSDDRGAQIKETLYAATSLFERLVWLIRQYGQLLRTSPRGSV